jgi:hypothetical protein
MSKMTTMSLSADDAGLVLPHLEGFMSPAKSASQFRLMKGICSGSIKPKDGITKKTACEFVENQSPKGLPEKKKSKK